MPMESNILLRIPSKEWKQKVAKYAKKKGMTLSTFIRLAVIEQMKTDIMLKRNPKFLSEGEEDK